MLGLEGIEGGPKGIATDLKVGGQGALAGQEVLKFPVLIISLMISAA